MVGISPYVVYDEQKLLVYHPVLSVMDSYGLYISLFFSVVDKIGWYINRISLLWTILVVISTGFFCHGQYWSVYPPVLSVVNNIGCLYIHGLCAMNKTGW